MHVPFIDRRNGPQLNFSDSGTEASAGIRATLEAAVRRSVSGPELREWESLIQERDPQLFFEGLLAFGVRQEQTGHVELAGRVYATVQDAATEGVEGHESLAQRARERLNAILGQGAVGPRAEFLLRRLAQESCEPSALLAMGTAGALFKVARLGMLSRLVAAPSANFFTRGLGARALASVAAFSVEAPAFTLTSHVAGAALGRSQDWSHLGNELASSYLVLGGMRLVGWGAHAISTGTAAIPLRVTLEQSGMLGGILLGHRLEEAFGLRERRDGATTLVDSLALLLQFNVAGNLTRHAFGERFHTWEQGLELQSERLRRNAAASPRGPKSPGSEGLLPRPVLAGGPAEISPQAEAEIDPPRVWMMSEGSGTGAFRERLIRAHTLRIGIAPPEGWRRRAELTQDYLEQLRVLPLGKSEVVEEIVQGLRMLEGWAESGDKFLAAIAFRHYGEMWALLNEKFTQSSFSFDLAEAVKARLESQHRLLTAQQNPRFLQALLQASPQAALTYGQLGRGLVAGSPRYRELSAVFQQLTAALSLGCLAPHRPALRGEFVAAFHATLHNLPALERFSGQEIREVMKALRQWMQGGDDAREELGRLYYPRFWRLIADRAMPELRDEWLKDLQDEIVYLQQTFSPFRTSLKVLPATLKSYPSYVEWLFQLNGGSPGNIFFIGNNMLNEASLLRPWILAHADANIRRECLESYISLMAELNMRAMSIQEVESFPKNLNREVIRETLEGAELLRDRWRQEKAGNLLEAIRDYLTFVEAMPVRTELTQALTADASLKPLTLLAMGPDPRVREWAQEAIVRILAHFNFNPGPFGGSRN